MKITQSQLQQIILEEIENVEKEELQEVAEEIPDLAKSGPELEKLIQQILPAIEQASGGHPATKQIAVQRLVQLLQQEKGVKT